MQLYKHQIEALDQTSDRNRVAYYLDMGLGKTFVGAEKMHQLGAKVNLVVCQKSKINDWCEHFEMHYGQYFLYDLTNKDELQKFIEYDWHVFNKKIIGVINYELAWRRKELLRLQDFTLMLDESSLIQNGSAKQSKFIMKLHPANVILLSGTPCSGRYENLLTQMHLLGWDISKSLYNRQYVRFKKVETDGFIHNVVDPDEPYINVERLKSKMADHGAVFMKTEEVFDLPEQNFIPVMVDKSKDYNKFMKNSYLKMKDGLELIGDMAFKKHLIARQLCGIYSKDKLDAFKDLVESTNDRLIVFYNFTEEAKKMIKVITELGKPWGVINGKEKNLAAYENYDNSVMLVQYQAGAMGLNLQKANKVIYYTLPERTELFEQSKKRIHRIGQDRPCFYYMLMCKGSVEEQIHETLLKRKDYTDELFEKNN